MNVIYRHSVCKGNWLYKLLNAFIILKHKSFLNTKDTKKQHCSSITNLIQRTALALVNDCITKRVQACINPREAEVWNLITWANKAAEPNQLNDRAYEVPNDYSFTIKGKRCQLQAGEPFPFFFFFKAAWQQPICHFVNKICNLPSYL